MKLPRDFLRLTAADFIVRSGYQMGKTPLLPIFAASLGATDLFLGVVVSVSTLTGLLFKPLIGMLSDRQGRRVWLLIGTAFFVLTPLVYRFVSSPEQLLLVRVVHGLATAIYGPVTVAGVAGLRAGGVAERLGWFGIARSGGYIVGPALAGWLLLTHDPVAVMTLVGLVSVIALVPVLQLGEERLPARARRVPLLLQLQVAIGAASRISGIWLAGALEMVLFIALYAVKTFLPVHALLAGTNVALVGLFFSTQEAAHLLARPLGGRLADRLGYLPAIAAGMLLMAAGLALLPLAGGPSLLLPALLTGVAQALIFPATLGLVARQIPAGNLGAAMGLVGMLQNLGKVLGPLAGGLMIGLVGYEALLWLLAALLAAGVATPLPARRVWQFAQGRAGGRNAKGGSDEAEARTVAEGHSRAVPTRT